MIRLATEQDIPVIQSLFQEVMDLHAKERPDIFKGNPEKYSQEKLRAFLRNQETPIYVAIQDDGFVVGYAFCQYRNVQNHPFVQDIKYCYLDDLCVTEQHRAKGIGTQLYNHVKSEAMRNGCTAIRLNVWTLNKSAIRFYEKLRLTPLSMILNDEL